MKDADARLRDVLQRATDGLDHDLDAAEQRFWDAAPSPRRGAAPVLLAAAAAVLLAVALPVSLLLRDVGPSRDFAGTHQVEEGFPGRVSYVVGTGWTLRSSRPSDLRLRPPGAPGSTVGLAVVRRVATGPGTSRPAPRDLPTWIKTRPDLTVRATQVARVGDLFGTRLELDVSRTPRVVGRCDTACRPLFDLTSGVVEAPAGSRLSVVAVNVAGTFVTAYAVGPVREHAAANEALSDLVQSLRIER